MNKIINRYFIREFVPPFLFSMFALTFILLMDQLFRLIDLFVRKGLPIFIVAQILVYSLPIIVSYTAPMAILVAVVMTFGRISQDNEILALKVSGRTFLSIVKTPLLITAFFMILLMFFNNYILPESNHRMRNLMLDVSRKRPAIRLPEGIFNNDFPGYSIYIGRKDEGRSQLYDITIYDLRNGIMITAPKGELKDFEADNIIQFVLYNGELHQLAEDSKYQRTNFSRQTINMQVNTEMVRKERSYRNDDELNFFALRNKIREISAEIKTTRNDISQIGESAIDSYLRQDHAALESGRFNIEKKLNLLRGQRRKLSSLLVEQHRKFSVAFACVLFILIGAPLGYIFKRGGIAGVLVGIMLFSLYYIMVLAGQEFADRRGFPPVMAMWLPDLILLFSGVYLFLAAEYEKSPLRLVFR